MQRLTLYLISIALFISAADLFVAKVESQTKPFTLGQILRATALIYDAPADRKNLILEKVIDDVRERGVDFALTAANEKLLRDEGASDSLIEVIRQNSLPVPSSAESPASILNPQSTPTPSSDSRQFRNSLGMEFVLIPSGSFMMGSSESDIDRASRECKCDRTIFVDETPQRKIILKEPFYMGRFEVTQSQWKAVMGTTVRQQRDKLNKSGSFPGEGPNYPMYYISWDEAKQFVNKLNALNDGYVYRLPTEAEWEYAARAGTTGDYHGNLNDIAWYEGNSGLSTHPVGTKQPNSFGLYDMSGNVSEWVEDIYNSAGYRGLPNSDSANLTIGNSSLRVLRGGSWFSGSCRSADRRWNSLASSSFFMIGDYGFRLVARPK